MFEMIYKMKNRKNKGFTLVELIVVLIILGILAALLLPTLTKYIDKAHEEAAVAQCRMGVMASKTVGAEIYEVCYPKTIAKAYLAGKYSKIASIGTEIRGLAEYKTGEHYIVNFDAATGKIISFVFDNGKNKVTYTEDDGYVTAASASPSGDVIQFGGAAQSD